MEDSILKTTKKILGVDPADPSFDLDIITHINSVLSILKDLGVGPVAGFQIEDDTAKWDEFITDGDVAYNTVKSYVYLRVRRLFDPPQTAFLMEAMDNQAKELEWRISTNREATDWVTPEPVLQTGGDNE